MTYHHVWRPKEHPHNPPDYDDEVTLAVRNWVDGSMNPQQQKLMWTYVMYVTGGSDEFQDLSYRPGEMGTRATDFAEGKRFVGMMLRKQLRPELTPKPKAKPEPRPTVKAYAKKRGKK